ncbi:hypothetical protein Taro_055425 [Colocasia esculenta]|uniref:Uncharacterized protein n=1 Tax=Colocasia esculenta TaxID=4460 RepID=A0A843XT93_COLES|nr:hypothetical protein [Colocasia esculenta]
MAPWAHSFSHSASSPFLHRRRNSNSKPCPFLRRATGGNRAPSVAVPVASAGEPTKLVTFLGKGGSGKTTAAVLAAQVVGEELGVLPGMDSIFSALEAEKLLNFLGRKRKYSDQDFDIIIYDGISTEETLRVIGAAERARWYVKYIRNLAEKTDIGRLSAPSFVKLIQESISTNGRSIDGKMSADIWDDIEQSLQKASSAFRDPSRFRCYLAIDPSRPTSISSALRYWGCAIQAGAHVSGAFGFVPQSSMSAAEVAAKFSPLDFAFTPYLSTATPVNWEMTVSALSDKARSILGSSSSSHSLVRFDNSKKTVTLFMPGFDKSEIKLYQYRGGSELLVEAGDQRRIIQLPSGLQGKVGGAKFLNGSLVVTLR